MSNKYQCSSGHEWTTIDPIPAENVDAACPICRTVDGPPIPAPRPTEFQPPRFDNYEILGELGRGGMGIVYKARQKSPRRTVALKLITRELLLRGPETVSRFRVETEAAARISHQGVVAVYEAGEQDGWPFLAMEFVEGGSLAQKVEREVMAPRDGALMVEQLAGAVAQAHENGIIHRDLKPDNVLLTPKGEPKISDFGLAKRLDAKATDLTQTGALLGTCGYMSPEQALGSNNPGPATDIYALGAILYRLLTGRPPLARPTMQEYLRSISDDDPVPIRALQSGVPPKLATICHKCLHKEPGKRYASAAALKEDLERFRLGLSIKAHPESTFERLARWARKRPAIAALSALLIFAILGGLGGIFWKWRDAVINERRAIKAEAEAKARAKAVTEANEELRRSLDRERKLHKDVESRFALAMKAIDAFHKGVSEDVHLKNPELKSLRDRLLRHALDFYQQLAAILKESQNEKDRAQLAVACHQLAVLTADVGTPDEAISATREALALYERLARDTPRDKRYVINQAIMHHNLAALFQRTGKHEEAVQELGKARKLLAALPEGIRDDAFVRFQLANTQTTLGLVLSDLYRDGEALREYEEAGNIVQALFKKSSADPRYALKLANIASQIGSLRHKFGALTEAVRRYGEAESVLRKLVERYPDVSDYRFELALVIHNTALAQLNLGRGEEALRMHRESLKLRQGLVAQHPTVTKYREALANSHQCLGQDLFKDRRFAEALASIQTAQELFRKLADENPAIPDFRRELAASLLDHGALLATMRQRDEAIRSYRAALKILETLVREYPAVPGYRQDQAQALEILGSELWGAGPAKPAEFAEGLRLRVESADVLHALVRDHPGIPDCRLALALNLMALGQFLGQRYPEDGLPKLREAEKLAQALVYQFPDVPIYRLALAKVLITIGDLLKPGRRYQEAQPFYVKAQKILEALVAKYPQDLSYRSNLGALRNNLGILLSTKYGKHEEALRLFQQAIDDQMIALQAAPRDRTYRLFLSNHYLGAASECRLLGRHADAMKLIRQRKALWDKDPIDVIALYNVALEISDCVALAEKNQDKMTAQKYADEAMRALEEAVGKGFTYFDEIENNPRLDPLRSRADFRKLLKKTP